MPCALPSLSSHFPEPAPFFNESMLQAVFPEKGLENGAEAEVKKGAEGTVEAGSDLGEGRKKKMKKGEDAETAEGFLGSHKEVLDLFKDGDIESW